VGFCCFFFLLKFLQEHHVSCLWTHKPKSCFLYAFWISLLLAFLPPWWNIFGLRFHDSRHWSTGITCWCANNTSECAVSDWIISWARAARPSSQPEKWLSHWPCKVVWFRCLAAASPFHAIQSHQCRWTGISAVNSDHWVGHLWFFRLDKNVHSQDFTSVCFFGAFIFSTLCKISFERLKHMAPVLVSCLHQD